LHTIEDSIATEYYKYARTELLYVHVRHMVFLDVTNIRSCDLDRLHNQRYTMVHNFMAEIVDCYVVLLL
jgi:hypothetical protein